MKKAHLLFFLLVMACFSCDTSNSDFGREKTFLKFLGDTLSNIGVKAVPLANGNYLVGSYSIDEANNTFFPRLIETNQFGNVVWETDVISDTNSVRLGDMIVTASGQIAMLGTVRKSFGAINRSDYRMILLTETGQQIWTKDFDVDGTSAINDVASRLIETADGGFALIGTTTTAIDNTDMYVIRLDADGNKIWDRVYGNSGNFNDEGVDIQELATGELIWYGTEQVSTIRTRLRQVKTNALGNILQDFNYQVVNSEGVNVSSASTEAGGMFVLEQGGAEGIYHTGRVGDTFVAFRTDLDGNDSWYYTIDKTGSEDFGKSILVSQESEVVVAGDIGASLIAGDIYITKLSSLGSLLTEELHGATAKETVSSMVETADGGLLICGTADLDNTNKVVFLMKADLQGRISE